MFGIFLSLLVIAGLLGSCGEIAMRVRLTKRASDKMAWWRRGGNEVADTYEQLFPDSVLPRYRRLFFWTVLVLAGFLLLSFQWKSN